MCQWKKTNDKLVWENEILKKILIINNIVNANIASFLWSIELFINDNLSFMFRFLISERLFDDIFWRNLFLSFIMKLLLLWLSFINLPSLSTRYLFFSSRNNIKPIVKIIAKNRYDHWYRWWFSVPIIMLIIIAPNITPRLRIG